MFLLFHYCWRALSFIASSVSSGASLCLWNDSTGTFLVVDTGLTNLIILVTVSFRFFLLASLQYLFRRLGLGLDRLFPAASFT